jgi:hypothetical protein
MQVIETLEQRRQAETREAIRCRNGDPQRTRDRFGT